MSELYEAATHKLRQGLILIILVGVFFLILSCLPAIIVWMDHSREDTRQKAYAVKDIKQCCGIYHDDAYGVTCWFSGQGLSCLPDTLLKGGDNADRR